MSDACLITQLKQQISTLQRENADYQFRIRILSGQKEDAERIAQNAEDTALREHLKATKRLSKENRSLKEKNKQLISELHSMEKIIRKQMKEVEQVLSSASAYFVADVSSFQDLINQFGRATNIQEQDTQMNMLRIELEDVNELVKRNELVFKEKIASLEDEILQKDADKEILKSNTDALEKQVVRYKRKVIKLQTENQSLLDELETQRRNSLVIDDYKRTVRELEDKLTKVSRETLQQAEKFALQQEANDTLVNALRTRLDRQDSFIRDLTTEYGSTKQKNQFFIPTRQTPVYSSAL